MTPAPKQVVRIITRLNVGGPARQALTLTRSLAPEFPTVLAAGLPTRQEGELSDPRVPVHRLPLVRRVNPAADARALLAARRLLTACGAQLVHTHMAKAGTVGRLAAATVRPRPRTVHTFHGHVLEGYFSAPVERAFIETERRLARRTDVLVAVSPQVRDALIDLGIGRLQQFEVVPLGLEIGPFLEIERPSGQLRRHIGIDADTPLVGVLGRLVPIKDIETMLETMIRLPGVHLAVLGDGELRSPLERRSQELGLGARVHFTGWWKDVPSAIADLDVVVLTSRNEGTPVAMIEALASARAVVATDVGGVRFVVDDGETGYLVAPQAPEQAADKIQRLLADRSLRARMGATGRERVRHRFGEDRLVEDIRRLYRELLEAPRPMRSRR